MSWLINNKHLFLMFVETGKANVIISTDSISTGNFLIHSLVSLSSLVEKKKQEKYSGVS